MWGGGVVYLDRYIYVGGVVYLDRYIHVYGGGGVVYLAQYTCTCSKYSQINRGGEWVK